MKIKKFNEDIDNKDIDPYGEENWNDEDKGKNNKNLYGQEIGRAVRDINGVPWNNIGRVVRDINEVPVMDQMQGVCPVCGSGDLAYEGPNVYGNEQISYEVDCMDCNYAGYEIYNIEFDRFARR